MPKVVDFPITSFGRVRLFEDAVSKLSVALSSIAILLDHCPSGPTKTHLLETQQLLEQLLECAKGQVQQLKVIA